MTSRKSDRFWPLLAPAILLLFILILPNTSPQPQHFARAKLTRSVLRVTAATPTEPLQESWTRADTGEDAVGGVDLFPGPNRGVILRWSVPYGAGIARGGAYTDDGVTWRSMDSMEGLGQGGFGIDSFAASGGIAVAGGTHRDHQRIRRRNGVYEFPESAAIYRSADGFRWRKTLSIRDAGIGAVSFVDGHFVAYGHRTLGYMLGPNNETAIEPTSWTSKDGVRWTEGPTVSPPFGKTPWRGRRLDVYDTSIQRGGRPSYELVQMTSYAEGSPARTLVLGPHVRRAHNYPNWFTTASRKRFVALARYDWSPRLQVRDDYQSTAQLDIQYMTEAWTTTDGEHWTRCHATGFDPTGLTTLGDRFVAITAQGLAVSDDGCNWSIVSKAGPTRDSGWKMTITPIHDRLLVIVGRLTGVDTNKGPEVRYYSWVWPDG